MNKFDYDELERRVLDKFSQIPPGNDKMATAFEECLVPQVVNIVVATLAEYEKMKSETQS